MCGIIGFVGRADRFDHGHWRQAQAVQRHRGPDGQNEWRGDFNAWSVHLAHQRLAIIDLSETGRQPMVCPNGGGVIAYNGELYNYTELRAELLNEGCRFIGQSDTEVLLRALGHWGIQEAIRRFNGMWAFAWLDRKSGRLWLSRDRCGEKPLYWARKGEGIILASELKTLLTASGERYRLNYQAVGEFLEQSLLDSSPQTFFEGIEQVPAGTLMSINMTGPALDVRVESYWTCPTDQIPADREDDLIERVRSTFIDSVRLRLRSDVPVGVLLSGGVDSSAIAAAIQHINGPDADLNLLSSVSDDPRFDESPFIDRMANHLGRPVKKVKIPLDEATVLDHFEKATWHNDAPLGGFSNVAHYLLMEKAKEHGITVILSGQGGDELLCGYRKYLGFWIQQLVRERNYSKATRTLWEFWRNHTVLSQFSYSDAKRYLPGWLKAGHVPILGSAFVDFKPRPLGLAHGMSLQQRQREDLMHLSVPILNHYEDRMSMAHSREIRLPFLDSRLIEMLVPAPSSMKLGAGWTKYIFRQAMSPLLPKEIAWRKDKQGFINPESEWLKRSLRKVITEKYLCRDSQIFRQKLVDRQAVLSKYEVYCGQGVDRGGVRSTEIFNPFALEVWLRLYESHIQTQ